MVFMAKTLNKIEIDNLLTDKLRANDWRTQTILVSIKTQNMVIMVLSQS